MFKTLMAGHKLGAIGSKWISATSVDPGDKGQVAKIATKYMVDGGMEAEDAWLTAMVNWMSGMPWPDSKLMVAEAIVRFLDAYEGKVALSANTILGARKAALEIIVND